MQHLLQLIQLDATHGSALDMFQSIKKFFDENNINMKNIIALGSDNASVMVGKFKGFQIFLREIVPHLIVLNCIYHTSAIIAKLSSSAIPKEVEHLDRSAYNYFSNSPKRTEECEVFTKIFSDSAKRLLRLSGTRWLEAYRSYNRLIELWPGLEKYFSLQYFEQMKLEDEACSSKISNEQRIYNLLTDQSVKAYVHFLCHVLNSFNSFNALFQSKDLMTHTLHASIFKILEAISTNIIVFDALSNVSETDSDIEKNLMPLNKMYLGPTCKEIIKDLPSELLEAILKNCQNFYITCLRNMKKRFLAHDDFFLKKISFC